MKNLIKVVLTEEMVRHLVEMDRKVTLFLANESRARLYEHLFVVFALGYAANQVSHIRWKDVKDRLWRLSKWLAPGYHLKISKEISAEVDKVIQDSFSPIEGLQDQYVIPEEGLSHKEIHRRLKLLHDGDVDPKKGKLFAYVYQSTEKHEKIVLEAQNMFVHLNALNPTAFPSLRRMEVEIVQMAIAMLGGGEDARGTLTSGGTESLLLMLKTYRDMARETRGITRPEVVLPITAHPAIEKGAHYFGITLVYVPLDACDRVDITAMERAITRNTMLIVASAPQYPHGILDPIEALGAIASRRGIPLHVDACIGGFLLPWLEDIPAFDLRVKGVTSISADVHKYGYTIKGASVLLYANDSIRRYQYIAYTEWPGGLFVSPSMLGTRGGGSIAAAWTSLVALGANGFRQSTRAIMATAVAIRRGIQSMEGLSIVGEPCMTILAFRSTLPTLNVHAVADVMQTNHGWKLERQHKPSTVHMTLMPIHVGMETTFLANLQSSVALVLADPSLSKNGSAAMYSGISAIPLTQIADDFLIEFLSKTYSTNSTPSETKSSERG
eukprot:gene7743-9074_t